MREERGVQNEGNRNNEQLIICSHNAEAVAHISWGAWNKTMSQMTDYWGSTGGYISCEVKNTSPKLDKVWSTSTGSVRDLLYARLCEVYVKEHHLFGRIRPFQF